MFANLDRRGEIRCSKGVVRKCREITSSDGGADR